MRKGILATALAVVMVAVGLLGSPKDSDAAFHLMRVYGAMGGAFGDTNIQYVELRMTFGGQNFVNTHDICFYDATGAPYAKFEFQNDVPNGANGASILVGSSEFDAAWAAGSPEMNSVFNGSNMTQIAPLADIFHPIRLPAGKIAFGTEAATTPAAMCQGSFGLIDSVAYGTGYSGSVDFGTKFNTDMPSSGTQAVRLTSQLCTQGFNCGSPPNNSTNYSILDVNLMANYPRNNSNAAGPLTSNDADGDGVVDGSDLCPGTAPAAPVDANGCSQAQVDSDADGFCNPGAPSAGPSPGCTGTDNCPDWANPAQGLPAWSVPAGDTDCDGYPNSVQAGARGPETIIQTDPLKHCSATSAANDEANDAWPLDNNDNQLVNGQDFLAYNYVFGQPVTNPDVNVPGQGLRPIERFDVNASGLVNGADILAFNFFFGKNCTAP